MHRTARMLIATVGLMGIVTASCSSGETDQTAASAGVASSPADVSGEIVVFAASSLTEAFSEMADAFRAVHPETTMTFNFAGSGDLVNQIGQGAPADVFVSLTTQTWPSSSLPARLRTTPSPSPRTPWRSSSRREPQGHHGSAGPGRSRSHRCSVRRNRAVRQERCRCLGQRGRRRLAEEPGGQGQGRVTKVTTGEADAGIVFVTDVIGAGDKAAGVAIPADVNVISNYPMVVTKQAPNPHAGRAFVDFVASAAGQAILARYGSSPPEPARSDRSGTEHSRQPRSRWAWISDALLVSRCPSPSHTTRSPVPAMARTTSLACRTGSHRGRRGTTAAAARESPGEFAPRGLRGERDTPATISARPTPTRTATAPPKLCPITTTRSAPPPTTANCTAAATSMQQASRSLGLR